MIVKELIRIQKQRGLTDSQFAESLGIHKVSWYRNKRTKVIGSDVLLRAIEIYPEVKEKFLSSFATDSITAVQDSNTTPAETTQDGKIRGFLRNIVDFLKVWFW